MTSILFAFSMSQAFAGGAYNKDYSKKDYSKKEYSKHAEKVKKDIVHVAASNEMFSTLVAAVKAADLVSVLQSDGPFTVFAPTDEAFAALPEGTLTSLLKPENKDQLANILKHHVVSGKALAKDVVTMNQATTVKGTNLPIELKGDKVMVGNAQVIKTDIKASNGVIHVIDTVLLPEDRVASSF